MVLLPPKAKKKYSKADRKQARKQVVEYNTKSFAIKQKGIQKRSRAYDEYERNVERLDKSGKVKKDYDRALKKIDSEYEKKVADIWKSEGVELDKLKDSINKKYNLDYDVSVKELQKRVTTIELGATALATAGLVAWGLKK